MKQYSNDYQENGQNAYTFTYDQNGGKPLRHLLMVRATRLGM